MRQLGRRRIFFIACSALLFVGLLWHQPRQVIHSTSKPTVLKTVSPNQESRALAQVLHKASMEDNTVIITIVDKEEASAGSLLHLFLESFRVGEGTKRFLNHLVIVALDRHAFHYCNLVHLHCFQLMYPVRTLLQKRNLLFLEILKSGYNFVFTEVDVVWLRNPLPHITSHIDISMYCHVESHGSERENQVTDGGWFYVWANIKTINLFADWNMDSVLYPSSSNRSLCQTPLVGWLQMKVTHLDNAHFSGFCDPYENTSQVCTVHANCCNKMESKVHDLRLVLDDWIKFRALTFRNNGSGSLPFSWRAPAKCREQDHAQSM